MSVRTVIKIKLPSKILIFYNGQKFIKIKLPSKVLIFYNGQKFIILFICK